MTPQQIVDKVTNRLRDGRGRAHENGVCAYKLPSGNKCAVGCLLPEDTDEQIFNYGGSIYGMLGDEDLKPLIPKFMVENSDLLSDLQEVHDKERNWDGNKFINELELSQLCKDFGLEYRPV